MCVKSGPALSRLVAHEDKLVVVVPAVFFRVDARLQVFRHGTGRAGAAAGHQPEALLLQHVERLLDEHVLQEEPGRVSVRAAVVRVARLVQRVAKHLPAEGDPTVHQQARDLAELHVGQPVPPELEAAPVADGDAARHLLAQQLDQPGQPVVLGLAAQPVALEEPDRDGVPCRIAQIVQHVPEQAAIAVDEVVAAGVDGQVGRWAAPTERVLQPGALLGEQRLQADGVRGTADVQLDHLRERAHRLASGARDGLRLNGRLTRVALDASTASTGSRAATARGF